MVCIDGAKCDSAPWLRRAAPRLRRDLVSTCRSCRLPESIRSRDRAVLLLDEGSESLANDHALGIGRRRIASFGHGNRVDPARSIAQELGIHARTRFL